MSSDDPDRNDLETALRRIESDESGLDRRTVTHAEPSLTEMVETLETVREHEVANLAIDPEPEPFEPLEVVFEVDPVDIDIHLPGEVVQFTDDGPILQFHLSEKTGVQIDRAVDALTEPESSAESAHSEGPSTDGTEDEADADDDGETLAETNPFLRGASDTLGGQKRRSGAREAVSSDQLDAYIDGSSSSEPKRADRPSCEATSGAESSSTERSKDADMSERSEAPFARAPTSEVDAAESSLAERSEDTDGTERPDASCARETSSGGRAAPEADGGDSDLGAQRSDAPFARPGTADSSASHAGSEASRATSVAEESRVDADTPDSGRVASEENDEPDASSADSWPSDETNDETPESAASSVIDALEESSEGVSAIEASPAPSESSDAPLPSWWEALLTDRESRRLEADDIDGALLAAVGDREPGVCVLEGALDTARVFIEGPDVYEITFEPRREQRMLGRLFRRNDKISESELQRARERAVEQGCSVPEAMVRDGVLSRAVVEAGRRARLRELLPEVRKRELTEARFEPFDGRPDEFSHDPLSLRSALMDRVFDRTRTLEGEAYRDAHERFRGQLVRPEDLDSFPIGESPLDDRQTRFVEKVLDAPKTFDQLVRESTMYEKGIVRLVAALETLGWVEVGDWDEETKTKERQAQKLVQLKTRMEGDDRFEQFDVHWTAHRGDIEESYEELSEALGDLDDEFEPESHEADVLADLRETLEETYAFLSDDDRRKQYRLDLKSKFQIRSAIQLYEDQLEQAQMQKNIPELRDHCNRLVELDPDHGEAKAFLKKLDQLEDED